jgi:hypothetical protein
MSNSSGSSISITGTVANGQLMRLGWGRKTECQQQ